MPEEKNLTRRSYLKYVGAGVVVVAVAGAGAYYATRPTAPGPTTTPSTVTATQTVTAPITSATVPTSAVTLPNPDWWNPDTNPLYPKEPVTLKMFLSTDFPPPVIRNAFMTQYPNIKMEVTATAEYAALLTALKTKDYVYDGFRAPFANLEEIIDTGNALDLGPLGASDLTQDYPEWVLSAAAGIGGSLGKQYYAMPEDIGPCTMLYRSDIFQKYGIEVPKTWDQFAAAARKLHQDSKGVVYLTTFSVTDLAATLDAWIWNMGGNTIQPVEGQKDTYRIFLNSPETKKVIEYWGALVDEKVIPSVAFYSEQADRMFSNNEFASMPIAAAWFGPCVLTKSYPQQATLWRIAPHPQWSEGENVQGMHGGSVIGVAKNAKYPNAAALFAMWCCASNPGVVMGWDQCVWTANQRILKEESTFGEHYKYYYGGQDYRDFLIPAAAGVDPKFHYTRFELGLQSIMGEQFGAAAAGKKSWDSACEDAQSRMVDMVEAAGGTVVP